MRNAGLAVGGPASWDTALLQRLPSGEYFGGCMRDITVDGDELLNIFLATQQVDMSYGCAGAQGVCTTAECGSGTCVDGWHTYECDCDFGCTGAACDGRVAEYTFTGPSLINITARASGLSSATQNGLDFRRPTEMMMAFRTRIEDGTLLRARG